MTTQLSSETIQEIQVPAQWIVEKRTTLNTNEPKVISGFLGPAYSEIQAALKANSIPALSPPGTITYSYSESRVDIGAFFSVAEKVSVQTPLNCTKRPAGTAVCLLHKGDYEMLGRTYEKIMAHISEAGKTEHFILAYEIYINDPGEIPNPDDWLTEVYCLLSA